MAVVEKRCPVCTSAAGVYEGAYKTYSRHYCASCDLVFFEPRKVQASFYEHYDSYAFKHIGLDTVHPYHQMFLSKPCCEGGKLLDIGCAEGAFLETAKKAGFDVYGIDWDRKSIQAAKEGRRLENVWEMSLDDFVPYAQEHNLRFDVITFFEVLEHVPEPGKFIQQVRGLLCENGRMAGSVPNRDRFAPYREGSADYPPHHFTWWSRVAVTDFLCRNELRNINVQLAPNPFYEAINYVAGQCLGAYGSSVARWIRRTLLGGTDMVCIPVKHLSRHEPKALLLKSAKFLRDAVFVIPTLLLLPRLKEHIYFEAEI